MNCNPIALNHAEEPALGQGIYKIQPTTETTIPRRGVWPTMLYVFCSIKASLCGIEYPHMQRSDDRTRSTIEVTPFGKPMNF